MIKVTVENTHSGDLMVGFIIDKLDRTANQKFQKDLQNTLKKIETEKRNRIIDLVYNSLKFVLKPVSFTYRNLVKKPIILILHLILRSRYDQRAKKKINSENASIAVSEFNTFMIGTSQCKYQYFDELNKRTSAEQTIHKMYQNYMKRVEKRLQSRNKRNRSELEAHKTLAKFLKTLPNCSADPQELITKENQQMVNYIQNTISSIINHSGIIFWSFDKTGDERLVIYDGIYQRQYTPNIDVAATHAFDELLILNFARPFLKSLAQLSKDISIRVNQVLLSLDGSTELLIPNSELASEAFRIIIGDLVGGIDALRTMIRQVTRIQEIHLAAKNELKLLSEFGSELKVEFNHIEQYAQLINELHEDIETLKKLQVHFRNLDREIQSGKIKVDQDKFHKAVIELPIQLREAKIWANRFNDIAYLTPESGGVALESGHVVLDHTHEEDTIVEAVGLYKTYHPSQSTVYALRGANLKVKRGEFIAVVGPSGTGKTTLINIMAGLDVPDRGKAFLQGRDISRMNDNALSDFRRRNIGFVFQQYVLDPRLTVYENVALPAKMVGDTKNLKQRVHEILDSVGLSEYVTQIPTKLSGGQMQRVIIARACINDPLVVFADEPTGDLDSETGKQIMKNFRKLCDEKSITIVLVTHDREMAAFADRIVRMKDGKVIV